MRLERSSDLTSDCIESFYFVYSSGRDVPGEAKLVLAVMVEATRSFLHGIEPDIIPVPLRSLIRSRGITGRGMVWHAAHRWFSCANSRDAYTYPWSIDMLNECWDVAIDGDMFRSELLSLAEPE